MLRDSFINDFINSKRDAIYSVVDSTNSDYYDDIQIEISDQIEETEGMRIDNLVSIITRLSDLNGIRVQRENKQLPANCIAINGKQHQIKNFLDENGKYPLI